MSSWEVGVSLSGRANGEIVIQRVQGMKVTYLIHSHIVRRPSMTDSALQTPHLIAMIGVFVYTFFGVL